MNVAAAMAVAMEFLVHTVACANVSEVRCESSDNNKTFMSLIGTDKPPRHSGQIFATSTNPNSFKICLKSESHDDKSPITSWFVV